MTAPHILPIVLLLLLAPPAHRSAKQPASLRARLSTLAHAVEGLEDGDISPGKFRRVVPKSSAGRWNVAQAMDLRDRVGAKDIAFARAYYGIGYSRSVALLNRLWRRLANSPKWYLEDRFDAASAIPDDFRLLYERWRRPRLVRMMEDAKVDGAFAEARDGALEDLWRRDPAIVLREAYGSQIRTWAVASAVIDMYDWGLPADRVLRRVARRVGRRERAVIRAVIRISDEDYRYYLGQE